MAETTPISILHKHPKKRGFVQVENSTVRDPRLSLKATGLLVYLISLPQGSPIGSRVISDRKPEGRSAIMSAFQELRDLGYVEQESHRRDNGTFTTVTHVYEVPPGAKTEPGSGSPGSENPGSENRPISLSESKTGDEDKGRSRVLCSACGQVCMGLEALYDHIDNDCSVINDPDFTPAADLKVVGE